MRYTVLRIYGRYEIRDGLTDTTICYAYVSETADLICKAMNELYEKDGKDEKTE